MLTLQLTVMKVKNITSWLKVSFADNSCNKRCAYAYVTLYTRFTPCTIQTRANVTLCSWRNSRKSATRTNWRVSLMLADNMLRLLFCQCFCTASLSAFLTAKLHWPLWASTAHNKTHTTTTTANIAQRHHVTTTHGEGMGAERELIYDKRGYSHTGAIFIWFHFTIFVPVTIFYMLWSKPRLTKEVVWTRFFLPPSFFPRAEGTGTRPCQGDRASSAESAGRKLCNLTHTHTHTSRGRVDRAECVCVCVFVQGNFKKKETEAQTSVTVVAPLNLKPQCRWMDPVGL